MKQHITAEQLNELSEEAKSRLREWWKPLAGDLFVCIYRRKMQPTMVFITQDTNGRAILVGSDSEWGDDYKARDRAYPLLSIGQMIEYLTYRNLSMGKPIIHANSMLNGWSVNTPLQDKPIEKRGELCDALWEACKQILE